MELKKKLKSIWNSIVTFYTSGTTASFIAIAVTAIAIILISVISVTVIADITSADEIVTNYIETSASDITETTAEDTTTAPPATTTTSPETTSLETTTSPDTTTPEETETTTVPETTTLQETTTPPETIAIEDIQLGNPEDSDEVFVDKGDLEDEFMEEFEPETPKPTTAPAPTTTPTATTKPSQQETTTAPVQQEPTTEPPVSEYACVVKGIDISKWNSQGKSAIDWAKVKASGVQYVIIRVGNRSISSTNIYEDPYFKTHIEGALSAGLQVGVYFYSQAITEKEALEEASFVLSLIKDYKITYPVVFDWEPASGTRVNNAKLTKAQATAIAKKFLSTIEGYGYEAMLYSYHSAIMNYFDTAKLSEYKTWVAWYFSKYKETGVQYQIGDTLPDTNYPYQMWQYSSTGTVPGIQGWVDLNVSFFSYTGSGVPSSAIILELPTTSYTTNLGVPVDYSTGVKAFNTAGLDISSSVTTTISDSKGNLISPDNAFKTAGVYTITYTIKDFTGVSKSAAANLTVRANPSFQLAEKELTFHISKATYDEISEAVKNNLLSVTDNEGNKLDLADVIITGLDACYEETETKATDSEATENISNGLIPGAYTVTYAITDSKGADGTADILLIIVDDEPITAEPDTSSDEDSSVEETSYNDETTAISTEID